MSTGAGFISVSVDDCDQNRGTMKAANSVSNISATSTWTVKLTGASDLSEREDGPLVLDLEG